MEQIAINILPKGAKPVCHSSQFDEGRQIMFNLFNDDTPYTLSGTETISVLVHKPDGAEVVDSVTNTSDSYVIWDVSADACELSGVCECELSIVENGIVLGSKNFTMKVEEDAYGGRNIEVRTASGRIATFSTNMVEPFKSLKSEINPLQDLHGYSKPWSGGGGKNKLEPCITSGTVNGITYTVNDDGTIKLSNTATSESIKTGNFDLKAGSYIYTSGVTESFDTYDTYLSIGGTTIARGISGYNSFTLAQDSTVMLGVRVRNGITPNVTIKPMIRLASVSDASFEPYSNICPISGFSALNVTLADGDMQTVDTATVNFGQTVYGGVLDVTNGKLKITHKVLSVDNNSALYSSGNAAYLNITDAKIVNEYASAISNKYEYNTWSSATNQDNNYFTLYQNTAWSNARLAFNRNGLSLSDFITSLTNNPIQVVYELATPTEITTTPENLTALSGQTNNVYGDTNGDTTVEYYIEV